MIDIIMKRRSIRKFTNEGVTEEELSTIISAGLAAPSAHNRQPCHIVVIRKSETLNKITEFHKYTQMLKEAPVAIVVCVDTKAQDDQGFWVQDGAAVTENILLAIEGLGLGGVWCGIYPGEERIGKMQELLGTPRHIVPQSIIALGHSAETKKPHGPGDPAKIHREKW